ncbi:MAG: DUF2723 domain-containing protein [Archangium sp.]|nr:DUF2723 domain-containing protein [Archangium sp.]
MPTASRWAAAAGVFAFFAYAATLHPGIPGGDAGELAAAACAGGVAHPPGYPLHGLLLRLFGLFGPKLTAFHLVSAGCSAFTVALLVDLVTRWTKRLASGVLAGAAWFASPLAWLYSTSVEVFALHALLVTAVAWALTVDLQKGTKQTALLLGVVSGLALTHHQTALFVVAPLWLARIRLRAAWPHVFAGLVLGCTPLLLLPLWSGHDTLFSWGEQRSFSGFFTHVLRREYGTFQLASGEHSGTGLGSFLGAFAKFEGTQSFAIVAGLALFGAFCAPRRWFLTGLACLSLSVGVFGALTNLPLDNPLFRDVVSRFFLMPHLMLCAAAGLALSRRDVRLSFGLAVVLWILGFVQRPVHDARSVKNYGLALLNQPDDAVVLIQGDLIGNSMRALQACEAVKPGLRVIDQQLLSYDWYTSRLRRTNPELVIPPGSRWHPTDGDAFRLQALLLANAQRPLIVCGGFKEGERIELRSVPWGLCERLLVPGVPFDAEGWFKESAAKLPSLEWTRREAAAGTWEERVRRDVWHARAQRGLTALTLGIEQHDDVTWLTRAYAILGECADRDEAPQPSVLKNLGIAAGRLGKTEEMKAALRRYLAVAPKEDPELAAVRALVEK